MGLWTVSRSITNVGHRVNLVDRLLESVVLPAFGSVVELEDTKVLKAFALWACRFDSCRGYYGKSKIKTKTFESI